MPSVPGPMHMQLHIAWIGLHGKFHEKITVFISNTETVGKTLLKLQLEALFTLKSFGSPYITQMYWP